ncbi:MAG: RNA polymerase sigma factor [Bacteroidales bacterium]|nr:RNA polymerase sigma factor [Bacteroidales bacterium]
MKDTTKLIDELKAGNRLAFKKLIESYQHKVVGTCYGFVKNEKDAEDIAQEVFIEIFRSVSTFKQESEISTWIYRISINKSLDHLRKQNRKKRIQNLIPLLNPFKDKEIPIPSVDLNKQEELELTEKHKILHEAIQKLPENQRIALTLNKFEDLSAREIAEIMETSLQSVESLIHRSKKNLKEILISKYQYLT